MSVPPDSEPGKRSPRQAARDRDEFILAQLKERPLSTTAITEALHQTGEDISPSGVRARLLRLEGRGLVFRVNNAGQGKEVEWSCRPAPQLRILQQPDGTTCEVSSIIDLASATATLTVTLTGSLDEILAQLSHLLSHE